MLLPFHRKYRPQKFADLDQTGVRNFFENLMRSGKLAQAYLLTGPRGTGKTSSARILAMMANCEANTEIEGENGKGKWQEPCGTCTACASIRGGRSSAVIEMDAASNRGIEDIRVLRERVGLVPTEGRYTFYIIDEVHMLTNEAFNALLKTLEEPPRRVVFCLCTTQVEKIPATVLSRCVEVKFAVATSKEIRRSLSRIVTGEQLVISDEALDLVGERAQGSFRDAAVLLETLLQSGVERIDQSLVEKVIGLGSRKQIEELIDQMIKGNAKGALEMIDGMMNEGKEAEVVTEQIVRVMLKRIRINVMHGGKVDERERELVEVMSKCFARFRDVPVPELALEMAVVEYCLKRGTLEETLVLHQQEPNNMVKSSNIKSQSLILGKQDSNAKSISELKSDFKTYNELVSKKKEPLIENRKLKTDKLEDNDIVEEEEKASEIAVNKGVSLVEVEVRDKWEMVLRGVSKHNHGLLALLKRTEFESCHGSELTVAVDYKFHKEQLEQDRYVRVIEEVLKTVFGGPVRLRVVLKQGAVTSAFEKSDDNLSGQIDAADQQLVEAVEEVFGV